jgi:hypothetical protein
MQEDQPWGFWPLNEKTGIKCLDKAVAAKKGEKKEDDILALVCMYVCVRVNVHIMMRVSIHHRKRKTIY